jgi:molybdopterin/thiamine biosynthesis adenylyltransferase
MANNLFLHEEIYRGEEAVKRLGEKRVVICGAGTLGSNLAETLVRQGFKDLFVIDDDRVETHNLNTQCYNHADIGQLKVLALKNKLYGVVKHEIGTSNKRLDAKNAKRSFKKADLIVDTFDNNESRQLVRDHCGTVSLLHAGLNGDYGEVVWDHEYTVPTDQTEGDACEYPLARNLAMLVVSVAAEEIVRFCLREESPASSSVMLKSLQILSYR